MRFVKENAIVDEFLFCQEVKERTRAKDVFDLVYFRLILFYVRVCLHSQTLSIIVAFGLLLRLL